MMPATCIHYLADIVEVLQLRTFLIEAVTYNQLADKSQPFINKFLDYNHITDSPACSILTSSNNDNYNCFFLSMKAFQGLLPTDKSCLDDSNSLVSIKKATHELLWKYLRGHLKRDQTLQVRFLFLVELWYTRSDVYLQKSHR